MLLESGLVDVAWLQSHVLYFDNLLFSEQVDIMRSTDLLISVHSAGLINGIFMKSGSVAMQIFNNRFVEFVFAPPLKQSVQTKNAKFINLIP